MSKNTDTASQDNKKTGKNNWNIVWNSFWLLIIFGLFVTISITMFIIPKSSDQSSNIKSSSKNYLDKNLLENTTISCKNRKECQAIERKFQQIKDDIYRGDIEKIQLKIDNQDKIINSLTFSVSLYAVLITVISIFFSLRESQRIDKALDEVNELKEKLTNQFNEELKNKLIELQKDIVKVKDDSNEFKQYFDKTKEKNEKLPQQLVTRDADNISSDIDNSVLQNEPNENSKNKNELDYGSLIE
ncbi:hypothetical protein [Neisseria mucosa]|uniref:hypothetical protein n=1 Tax=Neisseria mucosa TaxID=488 RepID=UPI001560CDE0|nr:hypothetical protein [Neisseria mucosa]QKI21807.1 hypothetical protein FOC66_02655 [Neisseria mucosa]